MFIPPDFIPRFLFFFLFSTALPVVLLLLYYYYKCRDGPNSTNDTYTRNGLVHYIQRRIITQTRQQGQKSNVYLHLLVRNPRKNPFRFLVSSVASRVLIELPSCSLLRPCCGGRGTSVNESSLSRLILCRVRVAVRVSCVCTLPAPIEFRGGMISSTGLDGKGGLLP